MFYLTKPIYKFFFLNNKIGHVCNIGLEEGTCFSWNMCTEQGRGLRFVLSGWGGVYMHMCCAA